MVVYQPSRERRKNSVRRNLYLWNQALLLAHELNRSNRYLLWPRWAGSHWGH